MLPSRRVRGGSSGFPAISPPLTVLLVVSFLTIFTLGRWSAHYGSKIESFSAAPQSQPFQELAKVDAKTGKTLVTYIFSDTDAEYVNNLRFFVRWGVRENDGADYIFVLQLADRHRVSPHIGTADGTWISPAVPLLPCKPTVRCYWNLVLKCMLDAHKHFKGS